MTLLKKIAKKYFSTFVYFYKQLKYRFFIILLLSLFVGVLDGFGLAMFMPMLELVSSSEEASGSSLGNFDFLVKSIENLGLSLNIFTVLAAMILFFIFKGVAQFISLLYNAILRKYFISKIRNQLLDGFNQIKYKYYVTSDVGRIQNTMSVEVERATIAFYSYTNAIQQAVMVLVYMSFAFFVDIRFALLVSIGGILTNILYKTTYKKTKGASQAFSKDSHLYQGQIIQYVANFKYLKATAFLNQYANHLRNSIKVMEHSRFRIGKLNAFLASLREPFLIIVVAAVILIQTQLLNADLGPILISLLFFYRALSSLLNLQNFYNRFLEQFGSLENLMSFQQEIDEQKEMIGKRIFDGLQNDIILKEVSLSYDEVKVLQNINLHINKNETIAFVGESGSGKTSLVNIAAGLIPVDKGSLFIDGFNSKDINIHSYQQRVGYITQDPVIFNDTIFNNVTLWAEHNEKNYKRFEEALKKAAIDNYVVEQPDGAETLLGNDGVNLSGGQKQRISIARELYKDIDVLIMDEATSALDSETEKAIQNSIDSLKGNYTILMVAHRLSTIRNADKIVMMHKGRIQQVGTFDELIATSPIFNRMIELQET